MTASEDEDENLAQFLESEVLHESEDSDSDFSHIRNHKKVLVSPGFDSQDEEKLDLEPPKAKRLRVLDDGDQSESAVSSSSASSCSTSRVKSIPSGVDSGFITKIPPEIFHHILKFLSSEDLISCSLVCRFLNFVAADESLWRRLYYMRWGGLPTNKLREVAWKNLYIQRDEEDTGEFVRNCPVESKEYYIQMQAAKRSQAPLPSQVNDDRAVLDMTVGDRVSMWKSSQGLTDTVVADHACSGETCSYHQIGDAFVCEKTGNIHVCDDTCREVILDPTNELYVCTISGHCFDRLLSPSEIDLDAEHIPGGATDEAEPFLGSGRFARAYSLGYNCADEKELEAALRFC